MAKIAFPSTPQLNDIFTANGITYQYIANRWKNVSTITSITAGSGISINGSTGAVTIATDTKITVSATAPSSPSIGDLWVDIG